MNIRLDYNNGEFVKEHTNITSAQAKAYYEKFRELVGSQKKIRITLT